MTVRLVTRGFDLLPSLFGFNHDGTFLNIPQKNGTKTKQTAAYSIEYSTNEQQLIFELISGILVEYSAH